MIAQTPTALLLLHLPDEVLINIFSYLDFRTLCNATLVSKHFDDLAEPFLYHTIEVVSGRQASALSASLHANPRRISWIRSLLVSTKFGEDNGLSTLPTYIFMMRNLQDLCLETPDCNAKFPEERVGWVNLQDRYERIFEAASAAIPNSVERALPNLRNCTLHFVDGLKEIYSMTKYAMLFLHPNLRSLTMSCASTDFPDRLLRQFQGDPALVRSTNLEHLHLEECDIFSPTLEILLSFPRALKSLKISEGIRYDGMFTRNSRMHGNVSPGTFVDAIAKHCTHSLEHLSLSLGYSRPSHQPFSHPGQHLNLSAFRALKQLDLDVRTVNLIRVRAVCDHATWRRLPPNLETLKVFGIPLGDRPPFHARRRVWFPFETCIVTDKAKHGVQLLSNLVYSYEYYREDDEPRLTVSEDGETEEQINQVVLAQRLMVEKCRELQPVFQKAGVRLEIEMVALPNGFIPPYLFTEDKPKYFTLWESAAR
ncbi:hypothetical protein Z517_12060 [Fonsecaea pedrosoi CBS 271.37]|uniref:F-box domain-containing protein n=1 Tax=Fonsecaea pedrosoi CBS 271.37 TaxID=1442368 RepID=A0A0D2DCD0_9EURO|nr:uncharacterized protein Z517_12060 [Fonsecaea pedrosoi CBS 271.37]KIW75286.1 hypothetical protein Z517_12060 [Fonsecaea pedrosoi CBS 271.37]